MSFLQKLRDSMARFMYGRYGTDALNRALITLVVLISLAGVFLRIIPIVGLVLRVVEYVLIFLIFFRMFSKNIAKRSEENRRFVARFGDAREIIARKQRQKRDTAHCYFTCRRCGTICRLPKGRGKLVFTCPKCGETRKVKT